MTTVQKRIFKIEDDLVKLDKERQTAQRDVDKRLEVLNTRIASIGAITVRVDQIEDTLIKQNEETVSVQRGVNESLAINHQRATALGKLASRIDQFELHLKKQQERNDSNTTGVLTCITRVKHELGLLEKEKASNKRISDNALKRIDDMEEEKRFTNSVLNDLLARVKTLEDIDDGVMVEHC